MLNTIEHDVLDPAVVAKVLANALYELMALQRSPARLAA
jgi:hypothetical protein